MLESSEYEVSAHPNPGIAAELRRGFAYAAAWQGRPREALEYAISDSGDEISEWDAALLRAQAAVARMFAFELPAAAKGALEAVDAATMLGHNLALCTALGYPGGSAAACGSPHS